MIVYAQDDIIISVKLSFVKGKPIYNQSQMNMNIFLSNTSQLVPQSKYCAVLYVINTQSLANKDSCYSNTTVELTASYSE